jgi:hypothetical protein
MKPRISSEFYNQGYFSKTTSSEFLNDCVNIEIHEIRMQ